MKSTKIIYWTATGLISAMMLMSGAMYVTNPEVKEGFIHLGFPSYFRIELAVAKILGAAALILPFVKGRAKEWTYAGFAITFISAMIAHISSGDPADKVLGPVIAMVLLSVSYYTYHKMHAAKA
jgi:uncharacterized membrane protein YjjP (DUF1212 family)